MQGLGGVLGVTAATDAAGRPCRWFSARLSGWRGPATCNVGCEWLLRGDTWRKGHGASPHPIPSESPTQVYPPPPLRPCLSYSGRRDCINLRPNLPPYEM